jgi:hypothetical protein
MNGMNSDNLSLNTLCLNLLKLKGYLTCWPSELNAEKLKKCFLEQDILERTIVEKFDDDSVFSVDSNQTLLAIVENYYLSIKALIESSNSSELGNLKTRRIFRPFNMGNDGPPSWKDFIENLELHEDTSIENNERMNENMDNLFESVNWMAGWMAGNLSFWRTNAKFDAVPLSFHLPLCYTSSRFMRTVEFKNLLVEVERISMIIERRPQLQLDPVALEVLNYLNSCRGDLEKYSDSTENMIEFLKLASAMVANQSWLEGWHAGSYGNIYRWSHYKDNQCLELNVDMDTDIHSLLNKLINEDSHLVNSRKKFDEILVRLSKKERIMYRNAMNMNTETQLDLKSRIQKFSTDLDVLRCAYEEIKPVLLQQLPDSNHTGNNTTKIALEFCNEKLVERKSIDMLLNYVLNVNLDAEADSILIGLENSKIYVGTPTTYPKLSIYESFFTNYTKIMREMNYLEGLVENVKLRLNSRDLYLQETITETAKKINNLEEKNSNLLSERNDILKELQALRNSSGNSESSTIQAQNISRLPSSQLQCLTEQEIEEEKEVEQWLIEAGLDFNDDFGGLTPINEKDNDDFIDITNRITGLADDNELLQSDLSIIKLQIEHLEAISRQREEILDSISLARQAKRESTSKHI